MRQIALSLAFIALCGSVAFTQELTEGDGVHIEKIEVISKRPLREIGATKSVVDSAVMHESITSSLADALSHGSTIFVKSYGRATLSTASFRGTAPSHTQVLWNGMSINSPMMGQVDLSLIPSQFIDGATLYHGASSVDITGGGLGGAVSLTTERPTEEGFNAQYVQGVGSFSSFDEYLHLSYADSRWATSTRVLISSSENDFEFRNYNSKEFVLDENGNIIGSYHPLQRNRNGGYLDIHAMQELYYSSKNGDKFSLSAWWMDSERGLAMLTSDRNSELDKRNTQFEQTLRTIASWQRLSKRLSASARVGYTYTSLRYLMQTDPSGEGNFSSMVDAQSKVNTLFVQAKVDYTLRDNLLLTANVTAHQHSVESGDRSVIDNDGNLMADTTYLQRRFELSTFVATKWQATERLGVGLDLRWEIYGDRTTPLIPALFVDYELLDRDRLRIKASATRNFRNPTLNDLYFRPGGNPDLKPEQGFSFDAGIESRLSSELSSFFGSLTLFNSKIDDWIVWIATPKIGIYTPINIRQVHSYGAEAKLSITHRTRSKWSFSADGNFAWTRSINRGDKFSAADQSVGKQLVYIPEFSSALTSRVGYRGWQLSYIWSWYSERYTMTSNNVGILGSVSPYFMSDISLEKRIDTNWGELSVKGVIYNLLNEEYETVLSRPMPRMNWSIFIGIKPKFGAK